MGGMERLYEVNMQVNPPEPRAVSPPKIYPVEFTGRVVTRSECMMVSYS